MDELLIFHHIPKAAGSTLGAVLRRQYGKKRALEIAGNRSAADMDAFAARPVEEQAKYRVAMGHGAYGLRKRIERPCRCVTMLRDPVDRVISHYRYVRRRPNHYMHERLHAENISLLDYATSGMIGEVVNSYTRFFSRRDRESMMADPDGALADARQHMAEDFILVGITERFDESLIMLKRKLNWRRLPVYRRRNVAGPSHREEVDAATRRAIAEANPLDVALYEHACQAFDKQVADAGESFAKELARFQKLNAAYGRSASMMLKVWTALPSIRRKRRDKR